LAAGPPGHPVRQDHGRRGGCSLLALGQEENKEQEIRRLADEEFVVHADEKQQAEEVTNSVDILLVMADASYTADALFRFWCSLVVHGTAIMADLQSDEIKFQPFPLVDKGANFKGSAISSIQDTGGDVKHNVRPVIQTLPTAKVNEGIDMVRISMKCAVGRAKFRFPVM
jgi:alcohol dehydrogenase (NADP+)